MQNDLILVTRDGHFDEIEEFKYDKWKIYQKLTMALAKERFPLLFQDKDMHNRLDQNENQEIIGVCHYTCKSTPRQ